MSRTMVGALPRRGSSDSATPRGPARAAEALPISDVAVPSPNVRSVVRPFAPLVHRSTVPHVTAREQL
jgi:hypothetical protein